MKNHQYVYIPIPDKQGRGGLTRPEYIAAVVMRPNSAHLRSKYRDVLGVWVHRYRFDQLKRIGYYLPSVVIRFKD